MDTAGALIDWIRSFPPLVQLSCALCALLITYLVFTHRQPRPWPGIPVVTLEEYNSRRFWQSANISWLKDARGTLTKGTSQWPHSCFQVLTASGYKIVVPNRFANELKNLPHLSFNEALAPDLMVNYPGFDGHRESLKSDTFIQEITRVKLTQSLGLVTDDLVEESRDAIDDIFGEVPDWESRPFKDNLTDLVSRLSSRVFLGKDLCRNRRLMQLFKEHTGDISVAMTHLQMCPPVVRPIVYWFIPSCTRLRRQVREISDLILPEVERRRAAIEQAKQQGEKAPKTIDSIAWMVQVANGRPVNYVAGQLALSFAAIHMTSDALCKCFMQLTQTPEVAESLQDEVKEVLQTEGWERTALYKLKLMDSYLKEVQRTNPMAHINMVRMVKKATTLSDGTVLPAGSRIMILDNKIFDPNVFPDPDRFDAERFLKLRRQPGEENRHQFVTVTSDQLGFGLGTHACPGRFFASNEMKISLCFMLLRYDFRNVPEQAPPQMLEIDMFRMCDPGLQIQMRSRGVKGDLALLQA